VRLRRSHATSAGQHDEPYVHLQFSEERSTRRVVFVEFEIPTKSPKRLSTSVGSTTLASAISASADDDNTTSDADAVGAELEVELLAAETLKIKARNPKIVKERRYKTISLTAV
jgi:hypothetical protein